MGHTETPQLRRSLGFWSLLAYGVGDMLGAGIYALVGRVAGIAGSLAWFSFAIAMLAATLTACVYAELATRFPKSGGAAHYCDQVFRRPSLSIVIGWLVLCSGLVSMATSSRAFAGYLYELSGGIPHIVAICGFLFIVGTVTYRGIRESSAMNILCTTIELSGLLLVLSSGLILLFGGSAPESPTPAPSPESAMGSITALLILQGAGLAFFACIGFEDIANVTEEVKSPERTVPRALLSAMAVVSLVYMLVAYVATSVVSPEVLGKSGAPLTTVVKVTAPWAPLHLFSGIAMFAVANTSLLNCVMASRLLYGMSREGLLPAWLGHVHPTRQTPYRASFLVVAAALVLAVTGTVTRLANTTSVLLLSVFIVVGVALLVAKRNDVETYTGFRVPAAIPVLSISICALLIVVSDVYSIAIAVGLACVGTVITLASRRGIRA